MNRTHRGRLFRKYFLLILGFGCGALLLSGGTSLYFSYQENKEALANLQQEKAVGAAARIEQFVSQIEQQLAFAALPQLGADGLEQRRIEFLKLLRVVPAVTDIAQIDARGREQLAVSRLKMDTAGANEDRSQEPAFRNARPGQTWYGPVYFRKETEPYMSIAVRSGGDSGPVTVAEVNLKFIWDVVSRIRIGQKGKAYVVDSTGHLVADPDIGLVLRKTSLSQLEQVKAAFAPGADESQAMLADDLAGNPVLTAYAPIEPAREQARGPSANPLGWKVFVEQPVSEVYAALDATILRTVALIVAGLLFSALAALWLARSMVRPIGVLQQGAARIGAGDLEQQIDVRTGDELQALAEQFNRMTAQLRESYAGLERKVEERTAELKQALEFQGATGEILSSISSSVTDTQPVFDAICANLLRLFNTRYAGVQLLVDGQIHMVALQGEKGFERILSDFPRPIDDKTVTGRAMLSGRVVQVTGISTGANVPEVTRRQARTFGGYEAIIGAPMMRGDKVIGAVVTARREPLAFDEKQVALIKAFADQAVIAIENARLFNETKESLERQTATSDILKVISSSTTDVQPVFEAIVQSGLKLFPEATVAVTLPEGGQVKLAAVAHRDPNFNDAWWKRFPFPLTREYMHGIALLDRRVVDVADAATNTDPAIATGLKNFIASGNRAMTVMPMMRGDAAIGTVTVARASPGALSDKQLALLRTFADQAVIAIENVRLFNETRDALERQTATSDILGVISSSTTDVQPVFDTIVRNAVKLCDAMFANAFRYDGEMLHFLATTSDNDAFLQTLKDVYPMRPDSTQVAGRAVLTRSVQRMEDALADPEYERRHALAGGWRRMLGVPLLRDGNPIGVIVVGWETAGSIPPVQEQLLKTFADQAVIAVENVRLFNETREGLERQTATSDILRVISDSPGDVKPILDAVAERATRLCETASTAIYVLEGEHMRRAAFSGQAKLKGRETVPYSGGTLVGRAVVEGKPIHVHDIEQAQGEYPLSWEFARQYGRQQTMLAVPLLREGRPFGTMFLRRSEVRPFNERQIALAKVFADQAAIGIENVRLFEEIREKSAQLEIANKHKSEFLANMSHELRTPLNAIIGFSEVLSERMFGEINEKQADYLKDIHESGKHLLSLINDILDLSKIEAGRMELELSTFDLPSALSNAMTLVRERAQRHGIELSLAVDGALGAFQGDERKFKQIMLNLLSNAVKFTPDGGRVAVAVKNGAGQVEIAVRDTGIGIAPEDHAAVFEEFKQVGRDYTRKAEGTGLGLALTKRFVELHGGEIRLESAPGKGSTFTVSLPIRP